MRSPGHSFPWGSSAVRMYCCYNTLLLQTRKSSCKRAQLWCSEVGLHPGVHAASLASLVEALCKHDSHLYKNACCSKASYLNCCRTCLHVLKGSWCLRRQLSDAQRSPLHAVPGQWPSVPCAGPSRLPPSLQAPCFFLLLGFIPFKTETQGAPNTVSNVQN